MTWNVRWAGVGLACGFALDAAGQTAEPIELAQQRPPVVGERRWRPSDPIRIGSRNAYMDIGLVGTFAAGGSTAEDIQGGTQLGGHDPNQRGFTVQGIELNLSGAVDPYFRGMASVLYSLDADNESFLELEEAWLETMSLPANLQLRAGQIYAAFGRHNPTHVHQWSFVDAPLVNGRFLGPDGLRNPGARVSWLMPTGFFSELSLGVQNSHGETASGFRGATDDGHGHDHGGAANDLPFAYRHADNDRGVHALDDLLYSGRYSVSFDLTGTQTILLGVSGAIGPNNSGEFGPDTMTRIYGADLYWKLKPAKTRGGFPFLAWQTEAMLREYEAGAFDWAAAGGDADDNGFPDEGLLVDPGGLVPAVLSAETLRDYGVYTQLLYGFRRGWVLGARYEQVWGETADYQRAGFRIADNAGGGPTAGPDLTRGRRGRVSPNLTWYPTEYSKVRLQYNYDDREGIGPDHSVWLQFEFVLGAHAAHQF